MQYDVDADIYEGPLPLLIELAKLNLLDVFLIKLVDLTQEYLDHVKRAGVDLNELSEPRPRPGTPRIGVAEGSADSREGVGLPHKQTMDLNGLSEPLPLLSNLMAIKARALLPKPPIVEDEEVPVSLEELERRLKEYESFKTVAQLLAELHTLQHRHFTRSPGRRADAPEAEAPQPGALEVGLADLMSAFGKVLQRANASVYEVQSEPWTVEMKCEELRMQLTIKRQIRFIDLFTGQHSPLELVVTFLALLELMRQRLARAIQEQPFTDILIELRNPTEEERVHGP